MEQIHFQNVSSSNIVKCEIKEEDIEECSLSSFEGIVDINPFDTLDVKKEECSDLLLKEESFSLDEPFSSAVKVSFHQKDEIEEESHWHVKSEVYVEDFPPALQQKECNNCSANRKVEGDQDREEPIYEFLMNDEPILTPYVTTQLSPSISDVDLTTPLSTMSTTQSRILSSQKRKRVSEASTEDPMLQLATKTLLELPQQKCPYLDYGRHLGNEIKAIPDEDQRLILKKLIAEGIFMANKGLLTDEAKIVK